MSEQGLETIESTVQKTHEWIAGVADEAHLEKRDAYKSLRAVLQTLRDRLPVDEAAHFGASLPVLLRGVYYEGWQPSKVPVKMSREEFLTAVGSKIVTDRFVDPVRITQCVLNVTTEHLAPGGANKIKQCLPNDFQDLWPSTKETR